MRRSGRVFSLLALVGASGFSAAATEAGVRDLWHALCGKSECETCNTTVYIEDCPECSRPPRKKKERACCLCPPLPPRAPVGFAFPAEFQGGFPEEDKAEKQSVPPDLESRLNNLEEHLTRLTAIVDRVQKRQLTPQDAAPGGTPAADPAGSAPGPKAPKPAVVEPRDMPPAEEPVDNATSYIAPPRPLFDDGAAPVGPR